MNEATFWFTEYEVKGTLTTLFDFDASKSREDREREALNEYIKSDGSVVETSTSKWYFGAIDPGPAVSIGKFGKEYTDEQGRYDQEEGDFIENADISTDIDYSMFIIDFERNILIYNTKGRIGHEQFRTRFSQGFSNHFGGSVEFETKFIKNTQTLEEIVDSTKVHVADFELKPSNPSSDPEWENLDDSIQEMLAEKLEIIAESDQDLNSDGLNMDEDLLEQAVEMAQTKYGIDYRLVYDDDGVIKTVTKEREPVTRRQEQPETLPELRNKASELITIATSHLR